VLARDALLHRIATREQEVEARRLDAIDLHALVCIEACGIGYETFEDKHATGRKPRGRIANARDAQLIDMPIRTLTLRLKQHKL
jgi:hypothetical protein